MAEQAAHLAGAQALDSTATDGNVMTYTPANGTVDGNTLYYAFYDAYLTPSVTVFRWAGRLCAKAASHVCLPVLGTLTRHP